MKPIQSYGYFYTAPNKPLEKKDFMINQVEKDQVVVEVAGCGLCHTDLSFISGNVKTKHEPPLILGHEISGEVVETGDNSKKWAGKEIY